MPFRSISTRPTLSVLRCFVVFVSFSTVTYAEDILAVRRFTTSDGLGHQTVRDILEAQDGSVWLATWGGGVSCYDGIEWSTYTVDDGLVDNMVRALLFDKQGGLWVGTSEGIGYFDGNRWVAYRAADTPGLEADSIYCITRRANGDIWFGPDDTRVQVFSPRPTQGEGQPGPGGVWQSLDIPGVSRGVSIRDILEARDGSMWIAMDGAGLSRVQDGNWLHYGEKEGLYGGIRSLVETKDGALWVASTDGVYRLNARTWAEQTEAISNGGVCIAQRGDGDLVYGTRSGLQVLHGGKWSDFELGGSIENPKVESMTRTADGSLWVGAEEGAFRVSASAWASYTETVDEKRLRPRSLYAVPSSAPLALDADDRLCRFEADGWRAVTASLKMPDEMTLSFVPASERAIWVLYHRRVRRYSLESRRFEADISLPETLSSFKLYRTRSGRVCIFDQERVFELVGERVVDRTLPPAGSDVRWVYSMAEAPDGSLWFGMDDGVEHWLDEKVEGIGPDVTVFQGRHVEDVSCSRGGPVWFAVPGSGLVGYDGETWTTYTRQKDGLVGDDVARVYEARDGALWVGFGNYGIASFRDNHWVEFVDDFPPSGNVLAMGESPKGILWFGADPGNILCYQPSQGAPDTRITAYSDVIAPNGVGVIGFDGIDAWKETLQSDLVYSYRFVSLGQRDAENPPWSSFIDEQSLITSRLAPGAYRFEVRAMDKDRNIDPSPASVEFRVLQPFWRTSGFLVSIGFLCIVVVLALGVAWSRHRRLRISEEKYKTLVQNANSMIVWWKEDGVITFFNEFAQNFFGYTEEEIVGQSAIGTIIPETESTGRDLLPLVDEIRRHPERHESNINENMRKDGTRVWVAWTNKIIFDDSGRVAEVLSVGTDITERKHAEKVLQEEREFTETVIQSMPGLFYVFEQSSAIFRRKNTNWRTLTGYSDEELADMTALDFFEEGPDRDECVRKMQEVFDKGFSSMENNLRLKNGKKLPYYFTGHRVAIANKTYLLGMGYDITERKRLEDQLRQAQKMEAVGQLAGGIAHDFNNILQGIIGYTEMAESGLSPTDQAYQDMEQVKAGADRAATLTRQLLAFSRRQMIQPVDLDLNDVIAGISKMLHRVIGEHIELVLKLGRETRAVHADPGAFEQVLMNLSVNARDAMPTGGQLSIKTESVLLDETFCEAHAWASLGEYTLLSVTDTGMGMGREVVERIFEPFFTTKETGKGTGLGLSMVYGIVKQHEGSIDCYSEPGKGTCFKIYLPIVKSAVEASEKTDDPPSTQVGGTETILLAEDDEMVRNLAVLTLERNGYSVLVAKDGEEALRLFAEQHEKIEFALLDVVMPKVGGREVYDAIRASNANLPVLFSSGYSADAIHTKFVVEAGLETIQKPYSPSALLREIRDRLDS